MPNVDSTITLQKPLMPMNTVVQAPSPKLAATSDPELDGFLKQEMLLSTAENLKNLNETKLHTMKIEGATSTIRTRLGMIETLQRSLG